MQLGERFYQQQEREPLCCTFMIDSRYGPQIFWVLATALAYTLLELAVCKGKGIKVKTNFQ